MRGGACLEKHIGELIEKGEENAFNYGFVKMGIKKRKISLQRMRKRGPAHLPSFQLALTDWSALCLPTCSTHDDHHDEHGDDHHHHHDQDVIAIMITVLMIGLAP